MADFDSRRSVRSGRLLIRGILCSSILAGALAAQSAQAQTSVVSACSGVSLPPSVVTNIVAPVLTGITGPIETSVNGILGLPLLRGLLPPLGLNVTGLLDQAASGAPISVQAVATDGTLIGPGDQCRLTADSITLDAPAGVAIGGNQISGLGANGTPAFAGDIDAIALGNGARAAASATGGVALGTGASVTAANGVALGAGSVAGRGPLAGYAAIGLAAPQSSAGEVSVGAAGALRQITNVAAGSAASDAATVGQVAGVAAQVAVLDASAIRYDGPARDHATLAGAGGTTLANVAPGTLSATSSEAVNGAQLFATNQAIANLTVGGGGAPGPVRYSSAAAPTVANGGTPSDDVTLIGASGGTVGVHNVRDGAVAAGSSDAVTGGQLFATNQAVAGNTGAITDIDARTTTNTTAITNLDGRVTTTEAAITNLDGRVTGNTTAITNLDGRVTGTTTAITNLDGRVTTSETRITNLDGRVTTNETAITNIDARTTANTTAITNLSTTIAGSTVVPVQYSDPATPTVPNGGTRTNDVTLVGADATAPVGLHNVRGGAVAAGSTDAVNGDQLNTVAVAAANSLRYDLTALGERGTNVTLAGGGGAAVTVSNLAAGAVTATSTQAVNGAQLYATAQVAQAAAAAGANSVQYDAGRGSVTLGGGTADGGAAVPVALRNVAAGTSATDAVNVGQLQAGMQSAVAQSASYTDARIDAMAEAVSFDLRRVRRDVGAGTSAALAAAGLPQANEAGRSMIAMGGGTYRGETALAFGASTFLKDGHSIMRLGATIDSRGKGGANAGFGYQF